jgi:hypothetical protein
MSSVVVAWSAQQRLHRTWTRPEARAKRRTIIAVAVARELTGFFWTITRIEGPDREPIPVGWVGDGSATRGEPATTLATQCSADVACEVALPRRSSPGWRISAAAYRKSAPAGARSGPRRSAVWRSVASGLGGRPVPSRAEMSGGWAAGLACRRQPNSARC